MASLSFRTLGLGWSMPLLEGENNSNVSIGVDPASGTVRVLVSDSSDGERIANQYGDLVTVQLVPQLSGLADPGRTIARRTTVTQS